MQAHGEPDSQGAIFVFKDDGRQQTPWEHARGIPHVRAELHSGKDSFLRSLKAWNATVNPKNSFLAIYAHMGEGGIATTPDGASVVSWNELASAMPKKVSTLWLAGCKSVLAPWEKPSDGPVTGTLLVTTQSRNWAALVKIFENEASLDNIKFFDQIRWRPPWWTSSATTRSCTSTLAIRRSGRSSRRGRRRSRCPKRS
jgi:hypothetical protein